MTQGERRAIAHYVLFVAIATLAMGVMKLAGCREISWWLVFSPIWLPFVVITGTSLILLAFFMFSDAIKERYLRNNRTD